MTDVQPPASDWDAIVQRMSKWEIDAAKPISENKAKLLAFLASAGITLVTVTFDGGGDSGQIEDIAAFKGDLSVELPGGTVEVMMLGYGADRPTANHLCVTEATENLTYDLLRQKHRGWENNDGAYGEFTFDVAAGTISLDYNERFTSSENFTHAW